MFSFLTKLGRFLQLFLGSRPGLLRKTVDVIKYSLRRVTTMYLKWLLSDYVIKWPYCAMLKVKTGSS